MRTLSLSAVCFGLGLGLSTANGQQSEASPFSDIPLNLKDALESLTQLLTNDEQEDDGSERRGLYQPHYQPRNIVGGYNIGRPTMTKEGTPIKGVTAVTSKNDRAVIHKGGHHKGGKKRVIKPHHTLFGVDQPVVSSKSSTPTPTKVSKDVEWVQPPSSKTKTKKVKQVLPQATKGKQPSPYAKLGKEVAWTTVSSSAKTKKVQPVPSSSAKGCSGLGKRCFRRMLQGKAPLGTYSKKSYNVLNKNTRNVKTRKTKKGKSVVLNSSTKGSVSPKVPLNGKGGYGYKVSLSKSPKVQYKGVVSSSPKKIKVKAVKPKSVSAGTVSKTGFGVTDSNTSWRSGNGKGGCNSKSCLLRSLGSKDANVGGYSKGSQSLSAQSVATRQTKTKSRKFKNYKKYAAMPSKVYPSNVYSTSSKSKTDKSPSVGGSTLSMSKGEVDLSRYGVWSKFVPVVREKQPSASKVKVKTVKAPKAQFVNYGVGKMGTKAA